MEREKILLQLASRLRVLRIKRGWSQEILAEKCGLHRNYIGHIERGELNPGLINLESLAVAFDLSVGEFLSGL